MAEYTQDDERREATSLSRDILVNSTQDEHREAARSEDILAESSQGELSEAPAWFRPAEEAMARYTTNMRQISARFDEILAIFDRISANWTQDEIRDTNATDYQGSQRSDTKTTGNQPENVPEQSEIIDIEAPLYEDRSFKGGVLDLDAEANQNNK